MNVRELKEILNQCDDNAEIITSSSNYELRGSYVKATAKIGNYKKEKQQFRDDFDHTSYCSEVYVRDENGEKAICIW
jgi:hypothetical protein